MQKGKLIVIEGPDGSGKTEQWNLLAARMKKEGLATELLDFPQYSKVSAGLINNYLRGIYGEARAVSSYAASLFYAVDRFDISFRIREGLNARVHFLANRYVASNGGHQGGKIKNHQERKIFLRWLYKTEHEILNIPKPDINIFLDMPVKISLRLIEKRGLMKDIHENKEHLVHAYYAYKDMIKMFQKDFLVIKCANKGKLRSKEDIHEEIWEKVKNKLGL